MRRGVLALLLITLAALAVPISGAYIETSVDLEHPYSNALSSYGMATYFDAWGNITNNQIHVTHAINRTNGSSTCAYQSFNVLGSYYATISCSGGWTWCYRASISAYATGNPNVEQGAGSVRKCLPSQQQECSESPLIVNLAQGAWELTGADDVVLFDLDADGRRDRTTWTAAESSLAFVSLDLNGNGTIDDARELFGNHTLIGQGAVADNGFEALRQYDENADGVVDDADPVWDRLLLWNDRNHDGESQQAELRPISGSAFLGLETAYHWSGRHDSYGNQFRYRGQTVTKSGGKPYFDIYFAVQATP